jgi:hypothetical protein
MLCLFFLNNLARTTSVTGLRHHRTIEARIMRFHSCCALHADQAHKSKKEVRQRDIESVLTTYADTACYIRLMY